MAEIWQTSWICTRIIGIKEFSRLQVRFLMLNTMCLTSLHNIQLDLINFIPGFSSLLMQMIFFLLLKQTVPNSDTRYFRASVIYRYRNQMVMYELMTISHRGWRHLCKNRFWPFLRMSDKYRQITTLLPKYYFTEHYLPFVITWKNNEINKENLKMVTKTSPQRLCVLQGTCLETWWSFKKQALKKYT